MHAFLLQMSQHRLISANKQFSGTNHCHLARWCRPPVSCQTMRSAITATAWLLLSRLWCYRIVKAIASIHSDHLMNLDPQL